MWKPKEKRILGRPWRELDDVIEIDFKEIGFNGVDWTNLAHDKEKW